MEAIKEGAQGQDAPINYIKLYNPTRSSSLVQLLLIALSFAFNALPSGIASILTTLFFFRLRLSNTAALEHNAGRD